MSEGDKVYKGLAIPIAGPFEAKNTSTTLDHATLTAVSGASGDFIVCQTAGGGEVFVITDAGNVEVAGQLDVRAAAILSGSAGEYLRFSSMPTTAPTTGLTKGDFFICAGNTNMQLALCIDTTQNTLRYFTPNSITFGRDTLA